MRYFDNQKYDEAGIVGVKLQKVVVALMVFHVCSLFFGIGMANFVGTACMLVLLFIGFQGASKRNPKLLRAYCVGSVVYIVGSILVVVFGIAFVMFYHPFQGYNGDDVSSPMMTLNPPQGNDSDVYPVSAEVDPSLPVDPSSPVNGDDTTPIIDLVPSSNVTFIDYPEPVGCSASFGRFAVVLGVALIIGVIVFALQIASIVMANRMRRYLIATAAHNLAHPRRTAEPQVMPSPAMIPVQVQPNNFGYYPMYTMNPANPQNGQQFYFNPYLQPQQFYPQPNAQV